MGYYTTYTLTVFKGTADLHAVKNELDNVMDYPHDESLFEVDDDENRIVTGDSVKWYDHDEDCATMSLKFPDVVFQLHGDGEQTGDMWDAYYRNGLCQICRAKVVFPPYDASKLKTVQQAQAEDEGRP